MIDILETISIAVIAVTIIAVSLLDSLHILDAFPNWVKSIPQITLAMTGIILGYLLWQRHRYLDELNRELKKGVEDIVSALGGETKIHNGRQQFYDYIVGRIRQAKQRIDIVSPSSYGNSLYSEKDAIYNREFLKAVKDAAKREVSEETGLKHLKTEEKIGQEHYFFKMEKEKNILHNKFVHYFLFKFVGKEKPKLQKEEGFVEFKWVSFRQAKKKIEYKETRKILEKAEEILKGPRQKNLLPNATSS